MSEGTLKKKERTWFYTFARGVAWLMAHTLYPIKVVGAERLNALEAPYILIANHDSGLDPIAVAHAVKKYEIRYIAKKELMNDRLAQWFFGKLLHAIAVGRHESDMMAMRSALKVLKEGHVLGIFPEGTRHKKGLMNELESGVAILALRANVPIMPVYLTPKLRPFRVTRVIVGEKMDISDLVQQGIDKSVCDALLERITQTYEAFHTQHVK